MISKNAQISNFVKIRQVRAELFHVDRQTADMAKPVVAFHTLRRRLEMGRYFMSSASL